MQASQQGSRIVFGTGNRNFTVFRRLRVLDAKVRESSSITSALLGGMGGLSQNADTSVALDGGGGK